MSNEYASVLRGISVLDSHFGSRNAWVKQIDMETLDLGSCGVCVLGQLFGDYVDGKDELGIESGHAYGFDTNGSFAELTAAWKEALGENKVLVEKGDVYKDSSGCCYVKVVSTQVVRLTDGASPTTLYVAMHGSIINGKMTDGKSDLIVLRKSSFEKDGTYSVKVEKFTFVPGQFITNSTGKVYYVISETEAREVKDQTYAVWTSDISRDGLRVVTLPNGKAFHETVK